jgi:two-component system KDP operon response regulator KdpE
MAGSNGSSAPPSVLVIEDDVLICKLLQVVLEHHGHTVDFADTYASGVAAIESSKPRLIILDLGLPDGDGLDLLRVFREDLHRSEPVLVLTAFRQEDKAVRAFQLGANDFVTKPFAPRELVARVERALAA